MHAVAAKRRHFIYLGFAINPVELHSTMCYLYKTYKDAMISRNYNNYVYLQSYGSLCETTWNKEHYLVYIN